MFYIWFDIKLFFVCNILQLLVTKAAKCKFWRKRNSISPRAVVEYKVAWKSNTQGNHKYLKTALKNSA